MVEYRGENLPVLFRNTKGTQFGQRFVDFNEVFGNTMCARACVCVHLSSDLRPVDFEHCHALRCGRQSWWWGVRGTFQCRTPVVVVGSERDIPVPDARITFTADIHKRYYTTKPEA